VVYVIEVLFACRFKITAIEPGVPIPILNKLRCTDIEISENMFRRQGIVEKDKTIIEIL